MEIRPLRERSRLLRIVAAGTVAAALLVLPSAAIGRVAANPTINVNYSLSGSITAALPDGTPLGVTSGSPNVIAGGWYVFEMIGPGGCASIPQFIIKGPGLYLSDNLDGGETDHIEHVVHLLPNSTYTWSNDAFPSVIHTFQTSSIVVGTPPDDASKTGLASSKHTTVSSTSLVGSGVLPFRGTLTGAVSAAGRLTVAFKGKSIATLKPGEYKISVTDQSSTNGFLLQKIKRVVTVTGPAFVGKRSASVKLTVGKWIVTPVRGKTTYSIIVR